VQLGVNTNGGCDFIEGAFEETFTSPVLNYTRWLPDELNGQEHCVGLPPSGPSTCTMMMASQVQLASTFADGSKGATLTLSQDPCVANPASCCSASGTCAYWAGAHLVSAGCIQWGVLEIEAAFNMPAAGGGFYFTALYVVNGQNDGSWNEIDVGMINNILGSLEFHATVFTASPVTPTTTLMDALNFAQVPIGGSLNVNTTIKSINGVTAPIAYFNTSFASSFHTYKVVWTKTTVVWMVDKVVYRNLTYAPWRPMSIRQILRTNRGNTAVGPAFPASQVFIRRIRYTPLSAQAVADAYRCQSMFACYGPMAPGASGTATSYVSINAAPPQTGRRQLLAFTDTNSVLLQAASASLVPGMPVSNVTVLPSAFALSFTMTIKGINIQGADALTVYTSLGLAAPLVSGLADDVIPGPDNILLKSVALSGSSLVVNVMVTGYSQADLMSDYALFQGGGATQLDSTAQQLNGALNLVSNSYITTDGNASITEPYTPPSVAQPTPLTGLLQSAACISYPLAWDATCLDSAGRNSSFFCPTCVLINMTNLKTVLTYAVSVPLAATAVDSVEAILSSALTSGAMASALSAASGSGRHLLQAANTSLTPTSSLELTRLLNQQCSTQVQSSCAPVTSVRAWRASAIAFIIAFGVLAIAVIAYAAFAAGQRHALAQQAVRTSYHSGEAATADVKMEGLQGLATSPA